MQSRIVFFIGFLFLATTGYSQDQNFYIYLCFGQSNMEGQGTIEAQDKTVDSRFQVMGAVDCLNLGRTMGSWYTAVPPLTRCYNGLSPADYFGKTMVANLPSNIKVGIINVSVAGCKIELFDKINYQSYASTAPSWMTDIINAYSGSPYARLVQIAQLAQKDGVIKGILLHQGESNVGDNLWTSKVKGVYDNLIADLSLDPANVPLLAGEVVNADQGGACASVNSIIATLPQTLPNSYVISSKGCTSVSDHLHFTSAGYREIGWRYGVKMLSVMGYDTTDLQDVRTPQTPQDPQGTESLWFEAERFVTPSVGSKFNIVSDAKASNGKYITVQPGTQAISEAATDSASDISIPFKVTNDTIYQLFARLNCPSYDDDSFWIQWDDGMFTMYNGLYTTDWAWIKLASPSLSKGNHKITITYREDGACLDKICITNYDSMPTGMGATDSLTLAVNSMKVIDGFALGQNYPNPFNPSTVITYQLPIGSIVQLKVYDVLGREVATLMNEFQPAGNHNVQLSNFSTQHASGVYFYTLKAGDFVNTKKMILIK